MDQGTRQRSSRDTTEGTPAYVHTTGDRSTDERIAAIGQTGRGTSLGDQFARLNAFLRGTDFEMLFHVGSCTIRVAEVVPDRDGTGMILTLESGGVLKRVSVPLNEVLLISFSNAMK